MGIEHNRFHVFQSFRIGNFAMCCIGYVHITMMVTQNQTIILSLLYNLLRENLYDVQLQYTNEIKITIYEICIYFEVILVKLNARLSITNIM